MSDNNGAFNITYHIQVLILRSSINIKRFIYVEFFRYIRIHITNILIEVIPVMLLLIQVSQLKQMPYALQSYACNHCSAISPAHSGFPQGSVLGPIPLTMYAKPLSPIIDSHSIHHSFADDLQLQMSAPNNKIPELLHSMQSCIGDVKA